MTFLAFADKRFRIHPRRETWTNCLPWGLFLLQTGRVDGPVMPPESSHLSTSFLCLLSQALPHPSHVLHQCLLFLPSLKQSPPQHSPSKLTPSPCSPTVPVLLCFSVSVLSDQILREIPSLRLICIFSFLPCCCGGRDRPVQQQEPKKLPFLWLVRSWG